MQDGNKVDGNHTTTHILRGKDSSDASAVSIKNNELIQ